MKFWHDIIKFLQRKDIKMAEDHGEQIMREALEAKVPGSTPPVKRERADQFYIVGTGMDQVWFIYNRDGVFANWPSMTPYGSC